MTTTLCCIFPSHSSFRDTKIRFLFLCVWQKWYILLLWQRRSTSSQRVLKKPHKQWGNSRPESNFFHSRLQYQLSWILFLKIFRRNIRLLLLNVQKDLCKMEKSSSLSDPSPTKINYRFPFEWLFLFLSLSFASKEIYIKNGDYVIRHLHVCSCFPHCERQMCSVQ